MSCERLVERYFGLKPKSGFDPDVIPQDDTQELQAIIDGGGKM